MKLSPKLLGLSTLAILTFVPTTSSTAYAFPTFERDYATEYCEYYKTRAAFAKQREANGIKSKYRSKTARYLRAQYITCLKKYATPRTYIPAR